MEKYGHEAVNSTEDDILDKEIAPAYVMDPRFFFSGFMSLRAQQQHMTMAFEKKALRVDKEGNFEMEEASQCWK